MHLSRRVHGLGVLLGAQVDVAILVDGDHHGMGPGLLAGALFSPRKVNVDSCLDDRRGYHKDDQQNQHDIDQRGNVNLRNREILFPGWSGGIHALLDFLFTMNAERAIRSG